MAGQIAPNIPRTRFRTNAGEPVATVGVAGVPCLLRGNAQTPRAAREAAGALGTARTRLAVLRPCPADPWALPVCTLVAIQVGFAFAVGNAGIAIALVGREGSGAEGQHLVDVWREDERTKRTRRRQERLVARTHLRRVIVHAVVGRRIQKLGHAVAVEIPLALIEILVPLATTLHEVGAQIAGENGAKVSHGNGGCGDAGPPARAGGGKRTALASHSPSIARYPG